MTRLSRIPPALLGLLLGSPGAHAAQTPEPHIYYSMVPGHFMFIGKDPDGGATYSGTAVIRFENQALTLVKTQDGKTSTAIGKVERAAMAEADVLRFTWPGHSSTCLVRSDLDNYSRLSCYWIENGVEHKEPGLEAYFPTETWPSHQD
ncbi:hypothetical protein GV819_31725 [Pseudomonas sp. Fl5BN2]|uniref:hypothetical protein n=1 Tax=unclassified Pseudomonas TaxID=196821 RepID=UPI001378FB3B|nr:MULTISPECIES: hypothetical protein [unclassified Pseudomonas]NBF06846.1 hypothetical protein [Pseudomonas sp. Fl5BN2]NBF13263.1 hypothetical protein [Pseudomonas sp. Fl4BN1]